MRILRAVALLVLASVGLAQAQTYPAKPVTLLLGLPAGGSVDMVGRFYAELVGQSLGQRVILDVKPGAGGIVAADQLAHAAPDGYTLMIALGGLHTVTGSLQQLPFDPIKDFTPITLLFSFPVFLTVPASSPANSVADLIEMAKKKPGGLNFGAQGVGSPQHLIGALLQDKTGMAMTTVNYKGGAPLVLDLAAGRLDFAFGSYAIMRPQLDDGKVKFLAIAAPTRLANMPNVPTLTEAGYPGVEIDGWFGLVAPRGTPEPIVRRLHDEFVKASRDPALLKRLNDEGLVVRATTPEEMSALMLADTERLGKLVRDKGIKIE